MRDHPRDGMVQVGKSWVRCSLIESVSPANDGLWQFLVWASSGRTYRSEVFDTASQRDAAMDEFLTERMVWIS